MANFVFGDVDQISCSFAGNVYRFYPKANETFNIDPGGIRVNDDMSQVTSDGQIMRQLNRQRWKVDGPIACDTITGAEFNALNLMSSSPTLGVWQFAMKSGAIMTAKGSPVGDIALDSNAGTIALTVSGNGTLQTI
ncbi:hypothetical protein [Flavobacterium phage FL-1]|nr:hypothetical protein [Flavobacterium phage FL-1]